MDEQTKTEACCHPDYKHPRFILKVLGLVLLAAIIIVSILRDRFVNTMQNQVTVNGQGKVAYQPDEATVTLGVRVEKVNPADAALDQLNEKMTAVSQAVKMLGIKDEDIKTGSYSLTPNYEYKDGKTNVSGYNASENIIIKVKDTDKNPDMAGKVISAASSAGANDVNGVVFSVSDINKFKQQARLMAIEDAKKKAPEMFRASGVRAKKVVGWYENILSSPDGENPVYPMDGRGGSAEMKSSAPSPQISGGTQEIIIEVGLNYEVE